MIVDPKLSWFRMLFTFRGTSVTHTAFRIGFMTLSAFIVTYLEIHFDVDDKYTLTSTPFTLIGLALGIFLGFRNNAAYERYWEGRTLLGRLVNSSRSWARQIPMYFTATSPDEQAEMDEIKRQLVVYVMAYVHTVKNALRDDDPFPELETFLAPDEIEPLRGQRNVPAAMLHQLGIKLTSVWKRGWLTDYHYQTLDATVTSFTDIQGGCERVKNTPIPYAYSVLIHRTVAFYCFFLPFGIVKDVQWLTPLVVLLISHAFFGLDEIGDEIEEPFGKDEQDLPVAAIAKTIEINLRQQLGEQNVEELPKPIDNVLM
ncbi:Bestrophin, RFP-TM, chloride channel [Polystyrenella longa]|uniref:Bestrophin, RFP-TM, chloride channel n=1 Tax=Polystyrenella longa TaxID=2528007 RepID=A0A518CUJ0_9PLAN|nr:bestrophin family protein [Polystyrenella longa]QDU82885.1 Bestrophin, RFP-TM, chloride channel [Polystyrenella longa]